MSLPGGTENARMCIGSLLRLFGALVFYSCGSMGFQWINPPVNRGNKKGNRKKRRFWWLFTILFLPILILRRLRPYFFCHCTELLRESPEWRETYLGPQFQVVQPTVVGPLVPVQVMMAGGCVQGDSSQQTESRGIRDKHNLQNMPLVTHFLCVYATCPKTHSNYPKDPLPGD